MSGHGQDDAHDGGHHDYGGLHEDLALTGASMRRRDLFKLAMGVGVLQLLGCADLANAAGSDENAACPRIPTETAGPYPGDGSNGPNVLDDVGVVRSDIRSSFAGLSGTAAGVTLTVTLTILDADSCAPLAGRAVYLWHCDRAGRYSLYSTGVTDQNYCRGVQETDAQGKVTFTTIFPGCYAGRWPHIHFEVYPSLAQATSSGSKVATSQLAFPQATCDLVYQEAGYSASITNLAGVSLATDNVFSDGASRQLATMTGDVTAGYTATLTVPI